jgi:hypothetical protein
VLRPWSESNTLVLTPKGVALRKAQAKAQLISAIDVRYAGPNALQELLLTHANTLSGKPLNILVSNHFVRYHVLPWHDKVYHADDWHAMAQYAFKKEYGASAENWLVRVGLGRYGESALAAAIDGGWMQQVLSSARQIGFRIGEVTPLLIKLMSRQQKVHPWTLIAEPERLLLVHRDIGGWQCVQVDAPPAGEEFEHACQMVERFFVRQGNGNRSVYVSAHVSEALSDVWNDAPSQRIKLAQPLTLSTAHPIWIAEI